MMRSALFVVVLLAIGGAAVSAQTAAPAPAATPASQGGPAAPAAAPAMPAPTPAEGYAYQPDGRRDPFVTLLGTGAQSAKAGKRNDGPSGLSVGEISVRGVLESHGSLIAMVEGPDKKTYVVHNGDKFSDGVIRSITSQGLVIVQEVNDPLSLVKQREIHKLLRSQESAKE
jgi:Tfp pilus assembly protein PilP